MNPLLSVVEKFRAARLLVVGDLMLDRFVWGEVERLSPEAPVPVLRVVSENFSLGGPDEAGRRIVKALQKVGASTAGVRVDPRFQTIEKSRIIASPHHQQIVR